MNSTYGFRRYLLLTAITLTMGLCASRAIHAQNHSFTNIFPLDGIASYSVEEMVANCGGEYADATANMLLLQGGGKSFVVIAVRNAPPREVFTIWLKLAQPSPLTGAGITALANPGQIPGLASMTPFSSLTEEAMDLGLIGDDGSGQSHAANGFRTNQNGYGIFVRTLNFPIQRGAYPFHEFDSSLQPMAIGLTPFTLRLASHCTDHKAHGLVPGKHEMFFDWSFN